MKILGVDFTSRPGPRKPIVAAIGSLDESGLAVDELRRFDAWPPFEAWLLEPGPWVGGFDFPFGLPRRFVDVVMPEADWVGLVARVGAMTREAFCELTWPSFRDAKGRPELKHREVDAFARSHSPLKTMDPVRRVAVNPPVGLMFFEGAPRLLTAGVHVAGLHENGDPRVALEAYPGALARRLGARYYKNDPQPRCEERRAARRRLLERLAAGGESGIACRVAAALEREIVDDPSGAALDAVLCAAQAAWGARLQAQRYGLPAQVDPVEGWIVGIARC